MSGRFSSGQKNPVSRLVPGLSRRNVQRPSTFLEIGSLMGCGGNLNPFGDSGSLLLRFDAIGRRPPRPVLLFSSFDTRPPPGLDQDESWLQEPTPLPTPPGFEAQLGTGRGSVKRPNRSPRFRSPVQALRRGHQREPMSLLGRAPRVGPWRGVGL